ncbi:Uncharacterised protein [BD1-7 clade bacterium]|uniref:Uncharacterized protein n=1 Tax=BD1-7 clade bacterium TaxID=2029982 RepID=A0A5S9PJT9_9GAMM|nr:Uncharacterised protein [BD1-7 clade bacterium]
MLDETPYFTWRIEAKGIRYEALVNDQLVRKDAEGVMIAYEEPVNHFMRTGKNSIALRLFAWQENNYGDSFVKLSLYVRDVDSGESSKTLLSTICFSSEHIDHNKGLVESMKAGRLDSTRNFEYSSDGDVQVFDAMVSDSPKTPGAIYIAQEISLKTPFPRWSYMDSDAIEYPEKNSDFRENFKKYEEELIVPLYEEHLAIYRLLKSKNFDKILPLFSQRNSESDIAYYEQPGTYEQKFKSALTGSMNWGDLKIEDIRYARPWVSDDRILAKIGVDSLIYYTDDEETAYEKYEILFYKKDGNWVIAR